jgi:hypothetical protein
LKDEESKSKTSATASGVTDATKNKGLFDKIFETVLFRRQSEKAIIKDNSIPEQEDSDSAEESVDYSDKIA